MTRMTAQEIEAAIETLRTSYSYDPPARWEKAHAALKAERELMEPEVRPYAWIRWTIIVVDLALALAVLTLSVRMLFDPASFSFWSWLIIFAAPLGIIPAFAVHAQLYVASKRHPTARFKAVIDGLVSDFDKRLKRFNERAAT